ncbi:MAG TPA: hypothetical protein VIL47_07780 [Candidatus Bipolaricaulota bacterium]
MRKIFHLLLAWLLLCASSTLAQEFQINSSQGAGWILLELDDVNAQLRQAGFPALTGGAQIYGGSSTFPQQDLPWRWGFTGMFWNSKGGESVSLDASFFGLVLDWTLRPLSAGRISSGVAGGVNLAQLTVRKGLAFDFQDVIHPNQGQFSQVQKWGVWMTPYLQYELSVLDSDFLLRAWGGYLFTPWLSTWAQGPGFFGSIGFDGPPSNLGGPFFMLELSFGL